MRFGFDPFYPVPWVALVCSIHHIAALYDMRGLPTESQNKQSIASTEVPLTSARSSALYLFDCLPLTLHDSENPQTARPSSQARDGALIY